MSLRVVLLVLTLGLGITGSANAAFTSGAGNGANAAQAAAVFKPVARVAPAITGTARQNQTLTATDGTWDRQPTTMTRAWLRCDADGANCVEIAGATGTTYRPGTADVERRLRFRVTAENAGGRTVAMSAATALVSRILNTSPPTNIAAPSISGSASPGATLTASPGTWTGSENAIAYEWLRCVTATSCSEIEGARAQTYSVGAADVGAALRVRVSATNDGGTFAVTSAPTSAVTPANVATPSLTGTAREEWTLTTSTGSWSPTAAALSYAWLRCDPAGANCTAIAGENTAWYVAQAADVGKTIRSQVTATVNGATAVARSLQSAVVVGLPLTTSGSLIDLSTNVFDLSFTSLKFGAEGAMPGSNAVRFFGGAAQARRSNPASHFNIGQSPFTIQAWVRVPRGAGYDGVPIIQRYECGSSCPSYAMALWGLELSAAGRPLFRVRDDTDRGTYVAGSWDVRDERWHLLTGVLSRSGTSGTMSMFVDGRLESTTTSTIGAITDDVGAAVTVGCATVAASGDACHTPTAGRPTLDDLALYRTALSAERVAAHWEARTTAAGFRAAAAADGAFAYWPMEPR